VNNYCALQGYDALACQGKLELHHVLSFGKARGNAAVRKILKTNPPELCIHLCQRHHQRYGNSRKVRRKLLQIKVDQYGEEWMRHIIDSLPWKVVDYSMTYDGLMGKWLKK